MQPAIYPRIRSEAEVLCAFGDITGLQQVQRCVKTPRVQVFGTGWVLMVASYGCKNIKKGATGDLAERRCTAASLGDFLWDDIRCMRLKWWTFIEKRRWQLTQLLPNQSRGRLHIKSDHKHLFDEFRLLAVWRYPSDFFSVQHEQRWGFFALLPNRMPAWLALAWVFQKHVDETNGCH